MNENKFNGMGKLYAQYRPSYPKEFLEYLYSDAGASENSIIADIGSGTGILTRQLLEKGCKVYAVEPNADMRAIAETELRAFDRFTSVNGSAEYTSLSDNSIEIITVAQAFHWFDRQRFSVECHRVLVPLGIVVLVWNTRDEKSELVRENDAVIKKYCPDFMGYSGGTRGPESDDDLNDFFVGNYDIKAFRNDLIFDEQGFIGRNLTGSYAPKEKDRAYPAYIEALKSLFDKYSNDGQIILPNITRSYVGRIGV